MKVHPEETLIRADVNLMNEVKAAITKHTISTLESLSDQWIST